MTFKLGNFFPKPPINEPSLSLDDPNWQKLEGGYRHSLYDASIPLKKLEQANSLDAAGVIYKELWGELRHQSDVGLASYYAVPHLVRISKQRQLVDSNVLGLVTLIEIRRHKNNPQLPKALTPAYSKAIMDLEELAKIAMRQDWNLDLVLSVLAAIALSKNQAKLANVIFELDDEEIDAFLEKYG